MPTPSTTHRWTRARLCRCSARLRSCLTAVEGPSSGIPTASGTWTSSLGSPSYRSVTRTRSSPNPSPIRPSNCCTYRTFSPTRSRTEAAVKINTLLRDATGHNGQLFFTNSGAEYKRVCHQTRPQARWAWSPHHRQHSRQLPRAHARHPRSHGPAHEARTIPTDARGLPPCSVGRHRCDPWPQSTVRLPQY